MKTITKNGLTVKQNLAGLLFIFGLTLIALSWAASPRAEAKNETATLQEAVEMSQANYDIGLEQSKDAMNQHCENWKALALAKFDLANAMKISTNIDKDSVSAVDCKSKAESLVPVSFL